MSQVWYNSSIFGQFFNKKTVILVASIEKSQENNILDHAAKSLHLTSGESFKIVSVVTRYCNAWGTWATADGFNLTKRETSLMMHSEFFNLCKNKYRILFRTWFRFNNSRSIRTEQVKRQREQDLCDPTLISYSRSTFCLRQLCFSTLQSYPHQAS